MPRSQSCKKKMFDKSVIGKNLMMPLYFSCLLEYTELLIDILVWWHFSQSDVHLSLAFRFFHLHCFQLVCDNVPFTLFNITVNSAVINKLRQDKGGQVLWCSGKRFCELWSAWYRVYFFCGRLRHSCSYWGGEIYFYLQNLFLCINGAIYRLVLWS